MPDEIDTILPQVLLEIERRGIPCQPAAIAEAMGLRKETIYRALVRLHDQGKAFMSNQRDKRGKVAGWEV